MPDKDLRKGSKVRVLDARYDWAVVVSLARDPWHGRSPFLKVEFTYRNRRGERWVPRGLVVRVDEVEVESRA